MEIGAALERLELSAGDPRELARFYASSFRFEVALREEGFVCSAPGRELVLLPGQAGQLRRVTFRFHDHTAFDAHRDALAKRGIEIEREGEARYTVQDPLGHLVTFVAPKVPHGSRPATVHDARLQHLALRTQQPATLAEFYVDALGFVVSDRVVDAEGNLTAVFLRTDAEHHAMAIFRAPMTRFDHFSCEVPGWSDLRDWADHMARVGVELAWGIGRHGPGNDTFLMVRDPDGNMAEISSELEVCQPGRPAGVWPHRPQTLNQWGVAIMRS